MPQALPSSSPELEAKARVRQQSGLGASQTAEVAYLDKEGGFWGAFARVFD